MPKAYPCALEVFALWGTNVLEARSFTGPGTYHVSSLLPPEALPEAPFALAHSDGAHVYVEIPAGAHAELEVDGIPLALAGTARVCRDGTTCRVVQLPPKGRCRLTIGGLTFLVAHVAPLTETLPRARRREARFAGYLLAAGVLHALFAALVLSIPDDASRLGLDGFGETDRFVEYMFQPELQKLRPIPPREVGEPAPPAQTADAPPGPPVRKPPRPTDPGPRGPSGGGKAVVQVNPGRVIADLFPLNDDAHGMLSRDEDAVGSDAITALGNLTRDRAGPGRDGDGLGPADGPGHRDGSTVDVGGFETRRPPGTATGSRVPRDPRGPGERAPKLPRFQPGPATVTDGLDAETVRRTIRQHQAEYRYCYERALNVHRDLEGKLTMSFTIGGNGSVLRVEVAESTIPNPAVAQCVSGKIRGWNFPPPRGGGTVVVRYPFVFRSTSGG